MANRHVPGRFVMSYYEREWSSAMTTAIKTRIIDSDGHVIETNLGDYLPEPYRGRQTLGMARGNFFPPIDHLHNEPVQTLPGSFNPAAPPEWAEFLDDAGVEFTVMYPSL